jgi:hypothetical protein
MSFFSRDIDKFNQYRQIYAITGLCEMFLVSIALEHVFRIDIDSEVEEDHSAPAASTLGKYLSTYTYYICCII